MTMRVLNLNKNAYKYLLKVAWIRQKKAISNKEKCAHNQCLLIFYIIIESYFEVVYASIINTYLSSVYYELKSRDFI